MYFGESAPKHLRGALSLSSAVFTAFGVVLGQVVGLRYGQQPHALTPLTSHFFVRAFWKCVPPISKITLANLFIERFWAVSRAGSTFLPVMPFLASFSCSPCHGSQKAPDTCSLTRVTRRLALMVGTVVDKTRTSIDLLFYVSYHDRDTISGSFLFKLCLRTPQRYRRLCQQFNQHSRSLF